MRKLAPHERAAFLLAIEGKAALVGVAISTRKAVFLDTEVVIVSFAAFFALSAAGAMGRAMTWAFVMYVCAAWWLWRRGGRAFV